MPEEMLRAQMIEEHRNKYMDLFKRCSSFNQDQLFHDCASFEESAKLYEKAKAFLGFQRICMEELKKDVPDASILDKTLRDFNDYLDKFEEHVIKEAKRRCGKL